MITDQDVDKLKQVFATKDDLKDFVTRNEWKDQNIIIANEFKGLVQLMGEMEERLIMRMDERFAKQDEKLNTAIKEIKQEFKAVHERNQEQDEKFDRLHKEMIEQGHIQDKKFYNLLEKMNDQYAILLNQEKRIAKTEHKLFPTT